MSPLQFGLYICLALVSVIVRCDEKAHWSYDDVDDWPVAYPVCGTKTQSPIDLFPKTIVWNQTIAAFDFHNYDTVVNLTTFSLINNGHSVQMNIVDESAPATPFWISGGGLPSNYTLTQFHFHWGAINGHGSEHTLEEGAYPMELHLVHWDAVRHPNSSLASSETEGLAVLGIFVQIAETNNSFFDGLIKYFQNITYEDGTASNVPRFPLNQLLPNNTRDFYRYSGSLTTPPCYNSVIWTVFKHPITISQLQLKEFRSRLFENGPNDTEEQKKLVHNYRATQPINDRTVYKTFEKMEWSYTGNYGADNWKYLYPWCPGEEQSPIDIATASAKRDDSISQFVFTNYQSSSSGITATLVNTGTSVHLLVNKAQTLTISGGGLSGTYVLEKVTLHWGEHNGLGSDHRVNGLAYPLEMQFFHYSEKYGDSSHASLHEDGLAILSVFFQTNPEDNPNLTPIWSKLGSIARPGNSTDIDSLTLSSWIPTRNMSFYRYSGSLTVPNCAQTVAWTVFTDPLTISAKQLNMLRSTVYGTGLTPLANNFRPPQNLNNRVVTRSVQRTPGTVSQASTKTSALSVILLFSVAFVVAIQTL